MLTSIPSETRRDARGFHNQLGRGLAGLGVKLAARNPPPDAPPEWVHNEGSMKEEEGNAGRNGTDIPQDARPFLSGEKRKQSRWHEQKLFLCGGETLHWSHGPKQCTCKDPIAD